MYSNRNPVEDNQTLKLTELKLGNTDTIVIQRKEKSEIIFEKIDQNWKITSPIENQVDPVKINLLLKFLNLKSRHHHIITDQKQLLRYDLNDPEITLFFNQEQFDFGNTNDFNHLRYVLHDGVVHSVKDITHHLLISDAESFVIENAK